MNNTVRSYTNTYLAGLGLFLVTLLVRELQVIYMISYFLVGLAFIFTFQQPEEDPQHSTIDHFERASRWNMYSYILAGGLVLAALLVSFLPLQPNWSTFIIWTLSVGGIYALNRYYGQRLVTKVIADYLGRQLPDYATQMQLIVQTVQQDPQISSAELTTKFKLNPTDADRLLFLYKQYISNNLL